MQDEEVINKSYIERIEYLEKEVIELKRLIKEMASEKIMNNDRKMTCQHLSISEIHPNVQLDEFSKVTCNKNTCEEKVFNRNGLGQGRNYGANNELPNMYNHYQCCPTTKSLLNKAAEIQKTETRMPPMQEEMPRVYMESAPIIPMEESSVGSNVLAEQVDYGIPMEEEIVNLVPMEEAPPMM